MLTIQWYRRQRALPELFGGGSQLRIDSSPEDTDIRKCRNPQHQVQSLGCFDERSIPGQRYE